jgi:hypothetical protein
MKPYGLKHKMSKICECRMCGRNKKKAIKRREREKVKNEIKKLEVGDENVL